MNAARLREQYQQTQLLLSELQSVGAEAYGARRIDNKHVALVRLAVQLQAGSEAIADADSRALWLKRAAALHNELVAVTALRLQQANQSGEQFWEGCVHLLYAAAQATVACESQMADMQAQMEAQGQRALHLQQQLQQQQAPPPQRGEAAMKEMLELRTRTVVLQQDVQRLHHDNEDLGQQLHVCMAERDALRSERSTLTDAHARTHEALERQACVIAQMMARSESSTREHHDALARVKQLDDDNHVLRVNLGQHAQMIEKLIELNTELMDVANSLKLKQEEAARQRQQAAVAVQGESEGPVSIMMSHNGDAGGQKKDEEAAASSWTETAVATAAAVPVSQGPYEEDHPQDVSAASDDAQTSSVTHTPSSSNRWSGLRGTKLSTLSPFTEQPGESSRARPKGLGGMMYHSHEHLEPSEPRLPRSSGRSSTEEETPGRSHEAIQWTSDMLLSSQLPPIDMHGKQQQAGVHHSSQRHTPLAASLGVFDRLSKVRGRARGLLAYVSGADQLK